MSYHTPSQRRLGVRLGLIAMAFAAFQVAAPVWGEQAMEEILVTARKRAESLQEVPAAVAAFNESELEERGIEDIREVARLTPNVTINETSGLIAGAVQVFIRGIGNDPGFDQGVGIYVDDVYLNRTGGALLDVYDIDRIEVLKGPQGNLYGRNTIGGAIKYVSAVPDNETRAKIEAKVGSDSLRKLRASVSGALMEDKLFGSIAVSKTDRDGYQTNLFDGGEYASQDVLAARGTLLWQASDSFSLKLNADLLRDDSDPYVPTRVAVNLGGPAGLGAFGALLSTANAFVPGTAFLAPGQMLDTQLFADEDTVNTAHIAGGFDEYKIDNTGVSLTALWDINDTWSFKSITSVRRQKYNLPFDFDGSDQVFINTLQRRDVTDTSQEFQLNYNGDSVNAVFGVYHLDGNFGNQSLTTQTPFLRLLSSHFKNTYRDTRDLESRSIYANVDWDINDQWQLSLGGRYTKDELELVQLADVTLTNHVAAFVNIPGLEQAPLVLNQVGAQVFPMLPFFNFFLPHRDLDGNFIGFGAQETTITQPENKFGSDEWSEFTPSARIRYAPSDDTILYAGYSSGFKSGGFLTTGRAVNATSFEPETVDTFALGLKTTLADGTLRINAELFQNNYEDKQVAVVVFNGGALVQTTDNVGEVESRGGELEITWLPPVEGLVFNFNVGYLDVEVEQLIDQIPGSNPPVIGNIGSTTALGYSPEWTAQARVQYTMSLGGNGSLTIGVDADYRDEMFTDSPIDLTDPFLSQAVSDERTLTNAFLTYRSADENWRVTLEGKNLSDKRVLENTFNVSNFILGGYNRERTWGLTFAYDFN